MVMDSQGPLDGHPHGPGSTGGGMSGSNKRPYEGSSSESVVSFATDSVSVTQNSVLSGSVANSVVGPDAKRPVKSSVSSIGCRQRITVVCAECKRLKLKCDRHTPCGSCTKRDTVAKCIYSQAAAEKVDVQSLNIRLQAVEGKLSGMSLPSDPASSSGSGLSHAQKKPSLPGLAAHLPASTAPAQQRAFLAAGAHGSSVAVNLEGVAGLWVDHLGLSKALVPVRDTPPSIGELDLERLGVRIVRQAGGSGIDLRPSSYPSIPAEGLLQFIEEYTELFRVPASRVATSETIAGDDRDHDIEHGREVGEDEASGQVGVSPKLVHHTFPPFQIRIEIYKRLEQHHFMSPSVNFMVFKNRIEEMCSWAEAELSKTASRSGSENGRRDELLPTTSTTNTSGPLATTSSAAATVTNTTMTTTTTGTLPPTHSFFAAACFGIALGARCWVIEQEVLGRASDPKSFGTDHASSPGPSNLGGSTNIYDPSMPPPPLPLSSFDTGGSASPASPASGPATLHSESFSAVHLDLSLPGRLYRVAKFSLQLAVECAGYEVFDTDYIHAKCLQARYLLGSHHGLGEGADLLRDFGAGRRKKVEKRKRKAQPNGETEHAQRLDEERLDAVMDDAFAASAAAESPSNNNSPKNKGKEKESARGPALALEPEMFGVVGDAVANARMMGLNHDPELTGAGRFSAYEVEMRRRLWWELVIHDAFVAECLGESPFINDDRATTELPADVDEESFGPDSANRPAPNIESMHGNIEGFIQRCRLVALGKKLKRKLAAFKELHPDAGPAETRELLLSMKAEIARWQGNLSDHLKLKEIPSNAHNIKTTASPSSKRPPSSPPERDNREGEESPHLIAIRCRLAISARHLFMNLCLSVTKDVRPDGTADSKSRDDYSEKTFDTLMMLEPAVYIVRVWRYLHSVYRNEHPALFMCYAFTRELFNAAVVLGHLAIKHPLFAPRALASLRLASETMRDPSVLTSKRPSLHSEENDNLPSEAVRIIEELIMKAEAAEEAANLEFGDLGPTSIGTPSMMKRKHEEVEAASSDLMYHFRFPFVGPGVVSAGPPAATPNPNPNPVPVANVALPLTNGAVNATTSTRNGASSSRTKHAAGIVVDVAATGDPRPATSKLKSSHPQHSIRNRNRKDSSRARANSTASQRSDASHILPPSSLSSTHGHGVPPNRLSSVEPSTPLLGSTSYPVPLSTTPGPGPPHYNSPPGTSGGTSSQPPPLPSNGGEFPSGFRDTGNFHSASPASYGPPFPPQTGPPLPVPSQVGFDSFNMESSDRRRDSISLGSGEASPFGFSSANGIDRPVPVGMHQPPGFDSLGGLPRPPSEPPQDRPFPRNLVENRPHNRDTDDRMGPPIQPLEHQPHPHPHPSLHPPQAYHPPMQQGWNDYPSWPYYP
ncbi:hypothetical protein ACEPAH_8045 [Sanghuangporus vaninii]